MVLQQSSKEGIFFLLVLQYSSKNALGLSHLSLNLWQLISALPALCVWS